MTGKLVTHSISVGGQQPIFSSHVGGCRKRAGNPFGAGFGMDVPFLAGKSPTSRCLLVEPVPTHSEVERASYT